MTRRPIGSTRLLFFFVLLSRRCQKGSLVSLPFAFTWPRQLHGTCWWCSLERVSSDPRSALSLHPSEPIWRAAKALAAQMLCQHHPCASFGPALRYPIAHSLPLVPSNRRPLVPSTTAGIQHIITISYHLSSTPFHVVTLPHGFSTHMTTNKL